MFDEKKLVFTVLFAVLALAAYQLNFSSVLGTENQSFTLFQFMGPITGMFLGPVLGVAAILATEAANFLLVGKQLALFNLLRFAPMLFAAYYFGAGKKGRWVAAVPIACMLLFWLHPVGQQAWFYALYWLIPLAAKLAPNRLFSKSLGATFTAHAVGSIAFLYSFPTEPALWLSLIPVVAYERLLFAGGIAFSYIAMNTVLNMLSTRVDLRALNLEPKYALLKAKTE